MGTHEHLMFHQLLGRFVGLGAALSCSVVTIAMGVTQALVEPNYYLRESKQRFGMMNTEASSSGT